MSRPANVFGKRPASLLSVMKTFRARSSLLGLRQIPSRSAPPRGLLYRFRFLHRIFSLPIPRQAHAEPEPAKRRPMDGPPRQNDGTAIARPNGLTASSPYRPRPGRRAVVQPDRLEVAGGARLPFSTQKSEKARLGFRRQRQLHLATGKVHRAWFGAFQRALLVAGRPAQSRRVGSTVKVRSRKESSIPNTEVTQ